VKVIVAGGSGFVGRHVVAALRSRGIAVVTLDRGTRPAPEGVERTRCDLVREEVPLDPLAGTDAVVNLVGIKRADGVQTFEAVHVGVVSKLIAAARALGIRRFVQVSVVCSRRDPTSPYNDTKWRAEELLLASGLDVTVLKPAVIYGCGDDMITHLVKMVRFAGVFPIVGHGESLLQPVNVRDVAEAAARALERPETAGLRLDVVGPERLELRAVVRTVAEALELPLVVVPTPMCVMRPAVAVMSAASKHALSSPAQLRMLREGLVGDPVPARRHLGLVPRRFTAEAMRRVQSDIPSLFGFSLRLVPTRADREWLVSHQGSFSRALALAMAGAALLPLLGTVFPNVWMRLAGAYALLVPAAFVDVRLPWRTLFVPRMRHLLEGVAAAAALWVGGATVSRVLLSVPWAAAQIAGVYGWRDTVPDGLILPLLLFIVIGEEIVWRNAVTLPLAARLGPVRGIALAAAAFAAAHLSLGVPVLLGAALAAGAVWSAMVVRTRSAVPALVCHLVWDLAVLFLWPYAGS
jgi:NADH dehydrogenase